MRATVAVRDFCQALEEAERYQARHASYLARKTREWSVALPIGMRIDVTRAFEFAVANDDGLLALPLADALLRPPRQQARHLSALVDQALALEIPASHAEEEMRLRYERARCRKQFLSQPEAEAEAYVLLEHARRVGAGKSHAVLHLAMCLADQRRRFRSQRTHERSFRSAATSRKSPGPKT
ncbi:MAG: hypothetical protein AAGE52_12060 [Myxococcota bacterium]